MRFELDNGQKTENPVKAKLEVDEEGDLCLKLSTDGSGWSTLLHVGKDGMLYLYNYGLSRFESLSFDEEGQIKVAP